MKIKAIAACGNGMGSSQMIKMKINKVFKRLGIDAEIGHMSVGEAKGVANNYDMIFVSETFTSQFRTGKDTKVIGLKNLLSEKEKANLRKEEIGFIFQNYNLIESLTIKNNILFSPRLNKVNQQTQLERLHELTKMLNIEEIIDKYPSQCSGGQQQRAAIARALINEPKIIFADEPTGNLDSLNARELMEYLVKINEEKHTTIIMVTHDSFVASYSKKVYYMKDGQLDLSIDRNTKSQDDYYKEIVKITTQMHL